METLCLVLEEDSELNAYEFAEYSHLLNLFATSVSDRLLPEMVSPPNDADVAALVSSIKKFGLLKWDSLVRSSEKSSVGIMNVTRNSPLEITFCGCMVILTLAVVLSGGESEISAGGVSAKYKLRSLGSGIQELRFALGLDKRIEIGFGVQSIRVKLSREEFALLMSQDPSTARKGGFQKFLIGLQYRINQSNREIALNQADIDWIRRHMENRSKGGFQGRIAKIFGRHF